jgi:hypothetical protein
MRMSARIRPALSDERGVTMIVAIGVLMTTALLLVAAFTGVNGDVFLARRDQDTKRAYYAAQAGISSYLFHLGQNVNYWTGCPSSSAKIAIGSTGESYKFAPLAASSAPAGDANSCQPADPIGSMIEGAVGPSPLASGTFRAKFTGYSGNATRTIVAQFRRTSFLDYVYYTKYETLDPSALVPSPTDCAAPYGTRGGDCSSIFFITGDAINGPMHSEDTLAICGTPVFGRSSADAIEAPAHSSEGNGGCSDGLIPTIGTYNNKAPSVIPPPSNAQLLQTVNSSYHFLGKTTLRLNENLATPSASTITVTNAQLNGGTATTMAWPANGVIYVSTNSSGCSVTYTPYNSDYTNTSCGNAWVGTSAGSSYNYPLTIAADNDIVINGAITTPTLAGKPTTSAELGLIANNFVRIYHPVSTNRGSTGGDCGDNSNLTGSMTSPTIDAAILALNHSFIVDNYDCGGTLGNLNVYGAIGQLFRGPVGTFGGSGTGYIKTYNYDDRLKSEEPPYFINPVQAAWHVQRATECSTSTGC